MRSMREQLVREEDRIGRHEIVVTWYIQSGNDAVYLSKLLISALLVARTLVDPK